MMNRILSRVPDLMVWRTRGSTQTTRVLSSNSSRLSKGFRLIPPGMAEYGDLSWGITVGVAEVGLTVVAEREFFERPAGGF